MAKAKPTHKNITIEFANPEAALHFATWLCEQGEQDYWQWMECREQEEKGDITATSFEYHSPLHTEFPKDSDKRYKGSKFLGDGIIRTTCGRKDKKE